MTRRSWLRALRARGRARGRLSIADSAHLGPGARLQVDRGAWLVIEPGARIGPHARLFARGGLLRVGADASIGERATIVALDGVTIGRSASIGQRAALIGFRVDGGDVEQPIRRGVRAGAIVLGAGAVVGHTAVIEAGVSVGANARVGPGVVVGRDLAAGAVLERVEVQALPQQPPRPRGRR